MAEEKMRTGSEPGIATPARTAPREAPVPVVPWRRLWAALAALSASTLIAAVRFYQCVLGPIFGSQCRFEPSCSVYFIEAVRKYGAVKGSWKGVRRIVRCNPLVPGGYDPP